MVSLDGKLGLPKVDHLGIDARIVLEQNNFSKKNPLTGLELQILELSVVLTFSPHALSLC